MEKPAVTRVPLEATIARRWSGRAYDAGKPVSQETIIALLEAARWAPSCFGDQPWRFIVWDKTTDPAGWQKAFECLVPGNQAWAKDAPVLLLTTAGSLFAHNGQPNRWGQYDTGAAAENLCLQATSMGLMAHQMGGFDAGKTREAFAIPDEYTLMAMMTLGYPADISTLCGEMLEREIAPRKRRELGELFFKGSWGQPVV
ncbi:MAG TPA: nitroreductase family protein [Methylophilaceae bacterium]|nr:nitroreductase family protein [Methylophilaceae bacterium]